MRRRGTSHRWHSPTFCGAGPPDCPPEERSNENFLAKAPEKVVEQNRQRLGEVIERLERLDASLVDDGGET